MPIELSQQGNADLTETSFKIDLPSEWILEKKQMKDIPCFLQIYFNTGLFWRKNRLDIIYFPSSKENFENEDIAREVKLNIDNKHGIFVRRDSIFLNGKKFQCWKYKRTFLFEIVIVSLKDNSKTIATWSSTESIFNKKQNEVIKILESLYIDSSLIYG